MTFQLPDRLPPSIFSTTTALISLLFFVFKCFFSQKLSRVFNLRRKFVFFLRSNRALWLVRLVRARRSLDKKFSHTYASDFPWSVSWTLNQPDFITDWIITLLDDFFGVPAVGGLKFSMAQKKVQKSASWGKCQLGEVPVGESASWGSASWGTRAIKFLKI